MMGYIHPTYTLIGFTIPKNPLVYVDFGFLDPTAMDALTRIRQTGGKIPDPVNGKLAVRVAMGFDKLAALHASYRSYGSMRGTVKNPESRCRMDTDQWP